MITSANVIKDYNSYIHMAQDACAKGDYDSVLNNIRHAAKLGYNMNFRFSDPCAEDLLAEVASTALPKYEFCPIKGRYVFYDGVAHDSLVLTKHYMRALNEWGVEFLYITEDRHDKSGWSDIMSELRTYKNAEIYLVPVLNSNVDKLRAAAERIAQFKPERAFLQLYAYDSLGASLWNAFPQVERYQINTTDHAYWLGLKCVDYVIEFRSYGWNLSQQYRGVEPDKQLVQPYYAAETKTAYRGLPGDDDTATVKLFSGGAEYKTFGENDRYLKIVGQILEQNPRACFYFAGQGNHMPMKRYIKEHDLQNRWFVLGHRDDIFEVMRNIDIYIGTYPMGGGLMTLIAAACAKPIAAFCRTGRDSKEFFSTTKEVPQISFYEMDPFLKQVKEYCDNPTARRISGVRLQEACVKEKEFNSSLKTLIETKKNIERCVTYAIDSRQITEHYLDIENSWRHVYSMLNINKEYLKRNPFKFFYYCVNTIKVFGVRECCLKAFRRISSKARSC